MPKRMAFDPIELDRRDLAQLLAFVNRVRSVCPANRLELKSLITLERALASAPTVPPAPRAAAPARSREREAPLPEIYGSHQMIPEDWRPARGTLLWLAEYLGRRKVAYDLEWLVAEFVTYWRGRGQVRASWQQAFRNNILVKLSRGFPLAPPKGTNGPRVFDRAAELRRQRLADFDRQARDLLRPDPDRPGTDRPVGPDDRRPPGKNPGG